MRAIVGTDPAWRQERTGTTVLYWAGHYESAKRFLALCDKTQDPVQICAGLRPINDHFAAIVVSGHGVFAAVDKVRSTPLFYVDGVAVSPHARRLRDEEAPQPHPDRGAHLEFVMTGYVTGSGTLCEEIRQLQAGEVLIHGDTDASSRIERYFRYLPIPDGRLDEREALAEYGALVDEVFVDLIARLDGRPAWIPLSGGYDSRIIACKLHELGYDNIVCFSYGPPQNHDSRIAQHVAGTLGLKWHWLPSTVSGSRKAFMDPRRTEYWRYADGLSVIPSIREWQALLHLVDTNTVPRDAVLINGQTGDYLSGGHIPNGLRENPTEASLVEAVLQKHWALWRNWLQSEPGTVAAERVRRSLEGVFDPSNGEEVIAAYEFWEYQERQAKFVIGGQRMYDYFGLAWELPHWDGRFLDFWAKVPIPFKIGQRLYKSYLQSWDYKRMFADYDPFAWRWPLPMMWVLPAAKLVEVLFGEGTKQDFYTFFWYFSHYHNLYGIWGFTDFLRTRKNARGPISLQVRTWLQENDIAFDPNTTAYWKALIP